MSEYKLGEPILAGSDAFAAVDPEDMLARIQEFPQQVEDAWENVSSFDINASTVDSVGQILVVGMGGSAIGGDLVAGLVAGECPVPVIVHRGYGVPAWVDDETLVIASSYSGGTEETLSGWNEAGERGALRIAVTTGGTLAETAHDVGAPVLTFSYDSQPRAALGHSFTLLYGLLVQLDLVDDPGDVLTDAVAILRDAGAGWAPSIDVKHNFAKQLASWYAGALPVVFGAEHLSAVARRWTTQINENSKAWAMWAEMPELNHNVVVGFEQSEPVAERVRVTNLRSAVYHERVSQRFDATGELLDEAGIQWHDIHPKGESRLAEMLWTIWLGDYVSYYLAALYSTDPTPVEPIARLKTRLAES